MTKTSVRTGLAALILAAPGAHVSFAEETCRQDQAVYRDTGDRYELRFAPVTSKAAATSHVFKIALLGTDLIMDGVVLPTEDVARSNGIVMHRCPEGDVTGKELEACTIWDGILYSIDETGKVANLVAGPQAAAKNILLADFGRSLRHSSVWGAGKATVAPWDALTYRGCGQ